MTGALKAIQAVELNAYRVTKPNAEEQAPRVGHLIDKYGHLHTEAVLTAWSPQALKALGVRRVGDEPKGGVA